MADLRPLYLAGCDVVVATLGSPEVGVAWDRPSVLEEQTVGGLAGHLARGAVWLVGEYLAAPEPDGPADFADAVEYFSTITAASSPADEAAIRNRGAQVAAGGHAALLEEVTRRLPEVRASLAGADPTRLVAVLAGRSITLDAYLATRIVEQVVHLDDLARSLARSPWPLPDGAMDLVVDTGLGVARARSGDDAVLRALYRRGFAEGTLPAL